MPSAKPLVVYVDVDDTLVRSFGAKRIPMVSMVDRVRQLNGDGALLFCWSAGGGDYARETARELGIEDCFSAFLPKPNVLIDDQSVDRWGNLVWLHPNQASSESAQQLRDRVFRK